MPSLSFHDTSAVEAQSERYARHLRRMERRQLQNATEAMAMDNATNATRVVDEDDVGTPYPFFVAHNSTMTCTNDAHAFPFNEKIRGVNLGSWMVLEPWITPGMFYQFLDGEDTNTGLDMWSFCDVLGPTEGNRQLREHWESWVTEDIVRHLAEDLGILSLRLPVGDWMYVPYGPYIGCTDGANDYVDRLLSWCEKYGLKVLFDVHAMIGSQNGFDNSGKAMDMRWTSKINTYPANLVTFEHWNIRTASWLGDFNRDTFEVDEINYGHIAHSLDVLSEIVHRYRYHDAVYGLEPVNEPWEWSPIEVLKRFYWEGYLIVKKHAPKWKYVMHDSFRFDVKIWQGFMDGCPERVLDTHIYQAWNVPASRISFYNNACSEKGRIADMEEAFGPVVIGEWSLATDNCAMWLNGFNDNLSGFPMLPCKYLPCKKSYLSENQPGVPLNRHLPLQGPYGTGVSGPSWGMCPTGRDWLKESSGNIQNGTDWIRAPPSAPPGQDASDNVMTNLARKKINAFYGVGHGFYFWNFRTELEEPHWSYIDAVGKGWIPSGSFATPEVTTACKREDAGSFYCQLKPYADRKTIEGAMAYCSSVDGTTVPGLEDLSDAKLRSTGQAIINNFWKAHHLNGATCDFGGIAMLVALLDQSDDEFDDSVEDQTYPPPKDAAFYLTYFGVPFLLGNLVCLLAFIGFMKTNRRFNKAIRNTSMMGRYRNSRIFVGRGSILGSESMPILGPRTGTV